VQVLTGSFVQRLIISLDAGGIYSDSLSKDLQEQTPNFWKWAKAVAAHPSVAGLLDEQWYLKFTQDKIKAARA
jgi:glutathione S-transferase